MSLSLARRVIRTNALCPLRTLISSRKYADAAPSGTLSLTFGSPTKSFFTNENVNQVDVPSGSGNFSILPDHVPIIAVMKPGCMTIFKDGTAEKFMVSSGTITVNKDSSAQILAEEAAPLDNFDIVSVQKTAEVAKQELAAAVDDIGKATAQIQIDACEALVHALEGK